MAPVVNGSGRMVRLALRAAWDSADLRFAHFDAFGYSSHRTVADIGSGRDIVIEAAGRFRKPERLHACFDRGYSNRMMECAARMAASL